MSKLFRLLPYLSLLTQIVSLMDAVNGIGALELRPSYKGKKLSITIRRTDMEPQIAESVKLGHPNMVGALGGTIGSVVTQIMPGILPGPAPVFSHA